MDPDEAGYRRSVRNMSLVLAAIVITVFAAIFASPYVFPAPDTFQKSVSFNSPFGFAMQLQVNATRLSPGGGIQVSGWLNSTSGSIDNISAADAWGVGPSGLWTRPCTGGWPLGIGVMEGHYTLTNVTMGAFVPIPTPATDCPAQSGTPGYFLLEPRSSRSLVDLNGTPVFWLLQSTFSLSTGRLAAGVYTAVLADEWGDVVTTNFVVS